MNMFKPIKPKTIEEYLNSVPHSRQNDINSLHKYIQKIAPELKPHFAYNALGYGSFPYKNYKKQQIEWPIISMANQKNYISIYVCAVDNGVYIAEKYKKELGKVSVGKSCIRFKKLEHLNLDILEKVIRFAVSKPGLEARVSK